MTNEIIISFCVLLLIAHTISLVNKSLIIQVIILTALLMMFGLMTHKTQKNEGSN